MVVEQLEAEKPANTEKRSWIETDQGAMWSVEEDADAAAAMFSAAINGKIAERLMSTDNGYKNNVVKSNKYSHFCEEIDDWSDLER